LEQPRYGIVLHYASLQRAISDKCRSELWFRFHVLQLVALLLFPAQTIHYVRLCAQYTKYLAETNTALTTIHKSTRFVITMYWSILQVIYNFIDKSKAFFCYKKRKKKNQILLTRVIPGYFLIFVYIHENREENNTKLTCAKGEIIDRNV